MTKITFLPAITGALLALGLSATPAAALANRTFVSGKGTDSGTCALAAPCRSFAFALTQTAASDEIDVLDPAGYGTITITKSISIVNDGVGVAGIQPGLSGTGIAINAGSGDIINLRGLTLDGTVTGKTGIAFNAGASLTLTNCTVRHFSGEGIVIVPTGAMSFFISNTLLADNGFAGLNVFSQGAGTAKGVIDHVAAHSNAIGIFVQGATTVMVRNSTASNNETGFNASGNATMFLAHSGATGNGTGVFVGSIVDSYGDNDINGNTTDVSGALTPIATK